MKISGNIAKRMLSLPKVNHLSTPGPLPTGQLIGRGVWPGAGDGGHLTRGK